MRKKPCAKLKIKKLDMDDPQNRAGFNRILKRLDKKYKPLTDAIRDSQRIRSGDLETRINV